MSKMCYVTPLNFLQSIKANSLIVVNGDCNPDITNPGIPAGFASLESRDCQHPNPSISELRKKMLIAHC